METGLPPIGHPTGELAAGYEYYGHVATDFFVNRKHGRDRYLLTLTLSPVLQSEVSVSNSCGNRYPV